MLSEPPDADPHVRWCGGRQGEPGAYPIHNHGVCNALSEREIEQFWHRWEALLPSPFTPEDRLRGYGYALSVRQLEISDGGDRISRA